MTSQAPMWPGRSPEYVAAADALVDAEHEMCRKTEEVAALRRALPQGSLVRDYQFVEGLRDIDAGDDGSTVVSITELFGDRDTLLIYSFMFDGTTERPCAMCTSLIDGYDGAAPDLEQRVGFAVVAPAPLAALRAYGRSRAWRNVRLLADLEGIYSRDSGGLTSDGELRSLMTVFTRGDDGIRHFYTSRKPPSGADQDDRHLDQVWALWGALDLTPEGRGAWRPGRPSRR